MGKVVLQVRPACNPDCVYAQYCVYICESRFASVQRAIPRVGSRRSLWPQRSASQVRSYPKMSLSSSYVDLGAVRCPVNSLLSATQQEASLLQDSKESQQVEAKFCLADFNDMHQSPMPCISRHIWSCMHGMHNTLWTEDLAHTIMKS